MPFTLAHPAAILPVRCLLRRYTVFPALVIGSMIPDLGHFVPLGVTGTQTHRLVGLLWFCLPAGVVAFVVFRIFLERPLIHLAPRPIRVRLLARRGAPRGRTWPMIGTVPLSLMLGSATHVAWDAFTHQTGPAVQAWAVLRVTVFTLGPHHVRLYKALQHGGTILGLAVMACWFWWWLRRTAVPDGEPASPLTRKERLALLAALIGIPVAAGAATTATLRELTVRSLQSLAGRAAVSGVTAFLIVLLGLGLLWPVVEARARRKGKGPDRPQPTTPGSSETP